MGYAGQVTWNAMRGHGLRFTVFRGQVGDEGGQPLPFGPQGDRDSLFAYHVELLYYPISLLYRLYAGPQTLIVLLTAVLALGAIPAYAIARGLLDHRGAALAFAAMYLLTPSIQGANLADFHAVSLTPTILLLALLFLFTRRDVPFLICATFAAGAKEEVGLLVLMMGLYAWLVQGRPRFGLAVAVAAGAWVALCFLVIIPGASGEPHLPLHRPLQRRPAPPAGLPGPPPGRAAGPPRPRLHRALRPGAAGRHRLPGPGGAPAAGPGGPHPGPQRPLRLHLATRRRGALLRRGRPRPDRRRRVRNALDRPHRRPLPGAPLPAGGAGPGPGGPGRGRAPGLAPRRPAPRRPLLLRPRGSGEASAPPTPPAWPPSCSASPRRPPSRPSPTSTPTSPPASASTSSPPWTTRSTSWPTSPAPPTPSTRTTSSRR